MNQLLVVSEVDLSKSNKYTLYKLSNHQLSDPFVKFELNATQINGLKFKLEEWVVLVTSAVHAKKKDLNAIHFFTSKLAMDFICYASIAADDSRSRPLVHRNIPTIPAQSESE